MRSSLARRVVAGVTALALVGVAVLVAVVSVQYSASTTPVRQSPTAAADDLPPAAGSLPVRAAFLGDSITVGNSDLAAGRIGPLSWFRDLVAGEQAPLVYAGGVAENGRSTAWMVERVPDVLAARPEVLFVLGGTNDVATGIPASQIVANLERIIDAADRAGVRVGLGTLPPLDHGADPATIAEVNAAIRDLADERGAYLLELGEAVAGEDGGWLPGLTTDGIHPSPEGAAAMSAAALTALRRGA